MAKVEIYYADYCPFCRRAKQLLQDKGIEFTLYDVEEDSQKRVEMAKRKPGARTIPQIFIDDVGVGGCDELFALDRTGELDNMIDKSGGNPLPPKP